MGATRPSLRACDHRPTRLVIVAAFVPDVTNSIDGAGVPVFDSRPGRFRHLLGGGVPRCDIGIIGLGRPNFRPSGRMRAGEVSPAPGDLPEEGGGSRRAKTRAHG